jgi:hypothetical protein
MDGSAAGRAKSIKSDGIFGLRTLNGTDFHGRAAAIRRLGQQVHPGSCASRWQPLCQNPQPNLCLSHRAAVAVAVVTLKAGGDWTDTTSLDWIAAGRKENPGAYSPPLLSTTLLPGRGRFLIST